MTRERRANKRLFLHSWVEITGVDESGLPFVERARLEDIGDTGCRFSMRGAVHQGSVLGLKPLGPDGENLADEFPRPFVVVWARADGDRLMVGARSLREDELSGSGIRKVLSTSSISEK